MKLKTMNKLIVVSSLLTVSPTISKAEAVYMCEPCPAGYSCNKGVKTPCPAGTFAQAGARECSKCPEGSISNSSHTDCLKSCSYSFYEKMNVGVSGGSYTCRSSGKCKGKSIQSKNGKTFVSSCTLEQCCGGSNCGTREKHLFNITLEHGDSVNGKTCDNGVMR